MFYSEKQYKELEEKYKKELQKLKKENELKEKENKLLKQQNKQKDEVIHDLDKNDYRGQCEALKIALKSSKTGDIIIVFYERLEPLQQVIMNINSESNLNIANTI